ncbi:MAG: carboxypeptidase-like regulatory domain-containing protein [Acidobacteriota bacterium]|nr:carboxypeptidase-like regulatory domain-containing protein [Acidobacteriota bacterium]
MRTRRFVAGVTVSLALLAVVVSPSLAQTEDGGPESEHPRLSGRVTSEAEGLMEGVVVTAIREGATIAVSVVSDAGGRYDFPVGRLAAGEHVLSIRAVGFELDGPRVVEVAGSGTTVANLRLRTAHDLETQLTNAEWLESIPGSE